MVVRLRELQLALQDKDWNVRMAAVLGLGELGDPGGLPLLRLALQDSDEYIRKASLRVLGQFGDLAEIRAALQDENLSVREAAVEELKKLGDLEGVRLAFHDENFIVRISAVRAFGVLRHLGGLPQLYLALSDEDNYVRLTAVRTLKFWKIKEGLSLALQNTDENVRSIAVLGLGETGDLRGVQQSLLDEKPVVRAAAIEALTWLVDLETSLPTVRIALHDTDPHVRASAVWLVGELGDQESIPQLRQALHDSDKNVRMGSVEALCDLGDEAGLRLALQDADPYVVQAAKEALELLD